MLSQMKCQVALLPLLCSLLFPLLAVAGVTYECAMEKRHEEQVCVFRNVMYQARTKNVVFKAPASAKVQHVAFENSTLEHIPKEFLSAFPDLKALNVVKTNLSSVVIPPKLERLYASDNRISSVIVNQTKDSTDMLELMLDSNLLQEIENLTQLVKLEILTLNGNKELPLSETVDFVRFMGLDRLRHLLLADVGMLYARNNDRFALPSLELLDISNNNFITTNLHVKMVVTMKKLKVLRLTHCHITDFEALELTENNPGLQEVYLEGNNFKCNRQKEILELLHSAGMTTPVVNKNVSCLMGFEKQNDMCCQSESLSNLPSLVGLATTPAPPMTPDKDIFRMFTTRMPPKTERPSTVAPKVVNVEVEKGSAAMVTLGNSVLSFALVAILQQVLF